MRMREFGFGSLAALLIVLGAGCKKSASEADRRPGPATNAPSPTLARVHWVGKKNIVSPKSSNALLNTWSTPLAAIVEAQALDKLALALAGERPAGFTNRVLAGAHPLPAAGAGPAPTNPPPPLSLTNLPVIASHQLAAKLRPLLDDLVREEWYLEVRQASSEPGELALAVRLDEPRAELWTSNLTSVVGAMTNAQSLPAPASRLAWRLPLNPPPSTLNHSPPTLSARPARLDVARAGEWTLLGLSAETNGLLAELAHRVRVERTPVAAPETAASSPADSGAKKARPAGPGATNDWLDADIDLRRLSSALSLGWKLPEGWPRLAVSLAGAGEKVRTSGKLTFARPLNLPLEPWNIPTNLIREPVVGFSAVRGVGPWLAGQDWFQKLQVQPAPNQFCAWAATAAPVPSYVAAPMTNAAAWLQANGPRLLAEWNPWVTNHAFGKLGFSNEPPDLAWSGIPMFTPRFEAISTPGGDFLLGRLGALLPEQTKTAPPELFAQLRGRSNLVYYGWEFTAAKFRHWVFLGQTARLVLRLPQLRPDAAAYALLLQVGPRLGDSATEIVQDGPDSLGFVRSSHLGFTALELHLLADWLQSPAFPRGLHTLLAPRPQKWSRSNPPPNYVPGKPAAPTPPTNSVAPPR